jgi:hypothetical protein
VTPKNGSKNAQNGSQQRTRLWPDSSVASKLTFEQRQFLSSQIKKLVARAERSNEPSTTARQTTTDRQTPWRSHQQKSLAGFLQEDRSMVMMMMFLSVVLGLDN